VLVRLGEGNGGGAVGEGVAALRKFRRRGGGFVVVLDEHLLQA
jgi:hypothetical protein